MASVWEGSASLPAFEGLRGDVEADALVIGAGMAGLLCARFLKDAGLRVVLVEAGRLLGGVSGHTTAKITAQHGLIYRKLLRRFGQERARLYLEANLEALGEYWRLSEGLSWDMEAQDAFTYSLGSRAKLEGEAEALERLGFKASLEEPGALPLPFAAAGALRFPRQAQFNPLKCALDMARGLDIYENTRVLAFDGAGAVTEGGRVRARATVAATHFPLLNKHGGYFLKLCQHRSYVLALEGAPALRGMYVDEARAGLSFRPYGELLLLGGGDHRTGKGGGGFEALLGARARFYPQSRVRCSWAAQDCMSLDGMPYIGQYGRGTPGLYVAAGFNKWGMTGSMAAARLLRDLVLGRENPYAPLFSPSRGVLRPQLLVNGFESAAGLLRPGKKRCPHMGCALRWNAAEGSWDCPCHGSRFSGTGRLMDNPANGDLKED